MKYKIKFTSRFKKDLKQVKKQGKDIEKLFEIIEKIEEVLVLSLLRLYIQHKNVDKVIETLIGDVDLSTNDYIGIKKNILTLVLNIEKKK